MLVHSVLCWHHLSLLPLPSNEAKSLSSQHRNLSCLKWTIHHLLMCLQVSTIHLKKVVNCKCTCHCDIHAEKFMDVGQRIFTHPYLLINNAASLCLSQHCFYCLPCASIVEVDTQEFLRLQLAHFFILPRHVPDVAIGLFGRASRTLVALLLMSAAISYSGLIPAKDLRLFWTLKCLSISRKTFFRHQCHYLQPAVNCVWSQQQNTLLQGMKTQKKKTSIRRRWQSW